MKELIFKQDAINQIMSVPDGNWKSERYAKEIENIPSVQPEIIRCKDCMWWDDGRCYCDDVDVRDQEYMFGDMYTEATHFCGYAGRREE